MENQDRNVIRNIHRYPVTFVTVVFVLLFVYFVIQGVLFFRRSAVQAFLVPAAGEDNISGSHKGLILRNEEIFTAQKDGYVTYFASSGDRLSSGKLICTLDSTGKLQKTVRDSYIGQTVFSQEGSRKIQNVIDRSAESYDPLHFESVMKIRADIQGSVYQQLLKEEDETIRSVMADSDYEAVYTSSTGFFLLYRDGYENRSVQEIGAADFTSENYHADVPYSSDRLQTGDFLYKTASDNKFSLVFLLNKEEEARYSAGKNMTIRAENGLEITGAFQTVAGADGSLLGVISFQKYGGNFLNSRFTDFQILDKSVNGYKIPESAIVKKSFFVVESCFITSGGESGGKGVLLKDGDSVLFKSCTVYQKAEDEKNNFIIGDDVCYVISDSLSAGDVLVAEIRQEDGSLERKEMTLGVMASVEGVYQINYGYCIFKPVVRLQNSLETSYVVVSPDVRGGIQAYDRIVLNAGSVSENDLIFE